MGYPRETKLNSESSHIILADVAEFGVYKDRQYISSRLAYIKNTIKFSNNHSYSCILVSSTKRYKMIKNFLEENKFSEVGSTRGLHGSLLFFYYRPVNATVEKEEVSGNALV